jgi:hypothetical protein
MHGDKTNGLDQRVRLLRCHGALLGLAYCFRFGLPLRSPSRTHSLSGVLGRFPVTLYREQWEKLVGMADEIRNFIRENDASLKKKVDFMGADPYTDVALHGMRFFSD